MVSNLYPESPNRLAFRLDRDFGMVNHALASGIRDTLKVCRVPMRPRIHHLTFFVPPQDYHILLAKLEALFLTSPTFTLQTALLYLHPTIHSLSLLYKLCITLVTEATQAEEEESDEEGDEDDEPSEDEMEKAIRAQFGMAAPTGEMDPDKNEGPGPIIGGEVLGVLLEREILRSG